MQQATNPGDPISSSDDLPRRTFPSGGCLIAFVMVSTRRFGRVLRTRDATRRQRKPACRVVRVVHSRFWGPVSALSELNVRRPASVRLGHRAQKPVVEMAVSPGMPRLSRCRRRLGPKQPPKCRPMVSLRPCLVGKNFQDFPSHRIFDRMYRTLNIDENKN